MRKQTSWQWGACVLLVAGCSDGFDFTMDDLEAIKAEGPQERTIIVESREPDGVVRLSQKATLGTVARFPLEVPEGHVVGRAEGCGGRMIQPTVFEVEAVTENCTIVVEYQPEVFKVEIYTVVDGRIDHRVVQRPYGQRHEFTVEKLVGYETQAAEGCGGTLQDDRFATEPVREDCTITISLGRKRYAVTVQTDGHGTANLEQQDVEHGTSLEIVVSAAEGYVLHQASGCGAEERGGVFVTAPITEDCVVDVAFAKKRYLVTTRATGAGNIDPETARVEHGDTVALRLTPTEGSLLESVTDCNGTRAGNRYVTGAITKDCVVSAAFVPKLYVVTVRTDGNSAPSVNTAEVAHGAVFSVQFEPKAGYVLESVAGCMGSMQGGVFTTAPMSGPCLIEATAVVQRYSVDIETTHGGSVRAETLSANHGDRIDFEVVPDEGFSVEAVTGCGATEGDGRYQTDPLSRDCEILVSFGVSRYAVHVHAPDNGRAFPVDAEVKHGSTLEIMLTPEPGYELDAASGCGIDISQAPYVTAPITSSCDINAWFKLESYAVTLKTGQYIRIPDAQSPPWSEAQWADYNIDLESKTDNALTTVTPIQRGSQYVAEVALAENYLLVVEQACGGRIEQSKRFVVESITEPCTIELRAEPVMRLVTMAPAEGGTASWATKAVPHGASTVVDFTADEGHILRHATGCGGTLTGTRYRTARVLKDCTISVEFVDGFEAPVAELKVGHITQLTWQQIPDVSTYKVFHRGQDPDEFGPAQVEMLATLGPETRIYEHLEPFQRFREPSTYYIEACATDGICMTSLEQRVSMTPTQGITEWVGPSQTLGNGFGETMALSADGRTLAIGAPGTDSDPGAVYVLERDGAGWKQVAILGPATDTGWMPKGFGTSLAMDDSGRSLIVGVPNEGHPSRGGAAPQGGVAYIFDKGDSWASSRRTRLLHPSTSGPTRFGASVAISGDGRIVAIAALDTGRIFFHQRGASQWAPYTEIHHGFHDETSVALSANGARVLATHLQTDNARGEVKVWRYDTSMYGPIWERAYEGPYRQAVLSADGQQVVYFHNDDTYVSQLGSGNPGTDRGQPIGTGYVDVGSLSRDGRTLVVALKVDQGLTVGGVRSEWGHGEELGEDQREGMTEIQNVGRAQVWRFDDTGWTRTAFLQATKPRGGSLFGTAVAIGGDDNSIIVGAPSDRASEQPGAGEDRLGAIYIY